MPSATFGGSSSSIEGPSGGRSLGDNPDAVSSDRGGLPGPRVLWRPPVAWVALGALMLLSAALIWAWSAQETLLNEEWGYAFRTATEPASQYLLNPPPGKHLIAVPLA